MQTGVHIHHPHSGQVQCSTWHNCVPVQLISFPICRHPVHDPVRWEKLEFTLSHLSMAIGQEGNGFLVFPTCPNPAEIFPTALILHVS